jgi:hydrogenase-4 component E
MQVWNVDILHFLAGIVLVTSFILLYQDRLFALLNVFAMQSIALALAVAMQAHIQGASHLYITAALALFMKGIIIPEALRRIIRKMKIHRSIETVVSVNVTMLAGVGLTILAIMVVFPIAKMSGTVAREDLAFALAVILLGMLMMITRRNAISQVIGFMALENGLILAATGAKGMPLVVEISVAFSVLIAFFVFGIFIFRIREHFDSIDVDDLSAQRGDVE